jgi:methionine-rich copper-binding protein CopC
MFPTPRGGRGLAAIIIGLGLLLSSSASAFAHARYDRSDPPAGAMLDGQPFVLKTYFTQELTSQSTIRVVDANGAQVDLADGRVDLDDPDRKLMVVSLPALSTGIYSVEWNSVSAEDGDPEHGTFAFGVGVTPPSANQPAGSPSLPIDDEGFERFVLDAY